MRSADMADFVMMYNIFQEPMIWNEEKDELLCREILAVNVFIGTKRSTVARGQNGRRWLKILINNKMCFLKWTREQYVTAITILQGS